MNEFFYTDNWINHKPELINRLELQIHIEMDEWYKRIITEFFIYRLDMPVSVFLFWVLNFSKGEYVFNERADERILNVLSTYSIENGFLNIDYTKLDEELIAIKILLDRFKFWSRVDGELKLIDELKFYDLDYLTDVSSIQSIYNERKLKYENIDWYKEKRNFEFAEMAMIQAN